MIYGPIWALIVSAATWLASSLGTALVFMKLLGVAILAISGKLLWDCMGVMGFTDLKKCTLLTLFLWNPFVIQITVVDVHNDSLLMLCFLASYLFLLKKNYLNKGLICFVLIYVVLAVLLSFSYEIFIFFG